MPLEPKQSVEDLFRDALKECSITVQRLSPHCNSFDELIGMLELAQTNDAQLRLLMTTIAGKGK
jgi:hypothetical protein